MAMVTSDFDSILEKYQKAKLNTYRVLELLGSNFCFERFGAKPNQRYQQLLDCGTYLEFETEQTAEKKIFHLTKSNFCRQRICPMCQFRKSEKTFAEMLKVVEALEADGYRFLHLVLTVPNAKTDGELLKAVKSLYCGFGKFYHNKRIKKAFKGCLRCLEVSYNYDEDTYHPHLHCLIVVKKSYFNDSKIYLSYDELRAIWTQSMKYESGLLQVYVRAMKQGDRAGVAEVCKYCVKPLDLGDDISLQRQIQNITMLLALSETLKGVRFLQRYGVVKDYYNSIFKDNDDDLTDGAKFSNIGTRQLFWNSSTLRYEGGIF